MRHLSFPQIEIQLVPGVVVPPSLVGRLVPGTRPAAGLAPGDRSAVRTVDVAPVAAPADHHVAATPRAGVETSGIVDHPRSVAEELERPRRRRDGLRRGRRRDHRDDPRRLGPQSRASTLSAAPFCHTTAPSRHPLRQRGRGGRSVCRAPSPPKVCRRAPTPTVSCFAPDQQLLTRAWRAARADRHQAADLRRRQQHHCMVPGKSWGDDPPVQRWATSQLQMSGLGLGCSRQGRG